MTVRMKCVAAAAEGIVAPAGKYLARYLPEAFAGQGWTDWTDDPAKAMTWPDPAAAMKCWRQVPRSLPRRPDGQANRPLTAYTVEIETVP